MPNKGGRRLAIVTAGTVLIGVLVAGPTAPVVRAADGFSIEGEVDGLYPGIETTLEAQVTNPYDFAIRVTSTTVAVGDASTACPASMLIVSDSDATVSIAPGATGTVPLSVRMVRAAPDACQGATWPLTFTGFALGPDTTELPATSMLHPRNLPILLVIELAIGVAIAWFALVASDRRAKRGRRKR